MKRTYLILAIAGAILPWAFVLGMLDFGAVQLSLLASLFANGIVAGFTVDLVFSSVVFWVFISREYWQDRGPYPGLFVALNIFVGLSCALPAWLYSRAKLAEQ